MTHTLYYVPALSNQPMADCAITPQPMYPIRKALARNYRCYTSALPANILTALQKIEQGGGLYVWAFSNGNDALQLMTLRSNPQYQTYPQPKNLFYTEIHHLSMLFPPLPDEHASQRVHIISGQKVCRHPHFGPHPGPGSIQSEAPHVIPRKQWAQAMSFGQAGIWLIAPDSVEQYTLSELHFKELHQASQRDEATMRQNIRAKNVL